MATSHSFGRGLRRARRARGLVQEDFATTSSRTYVSLLERGEKSPTLAKIDELCSTLQLHPLTLVMLGYVKTSAELRALLIKVEKEADIVLGATQDEGDS